MPYLLIQPTSADGKYYGKEESQSFRTLSAGYIDKWLWKRNRAGLENSLCTFYSEVSCNTEQIFFFFNFDGQNCPQYVTAAGLWLSAETI